MTINSLTTDIYESIKAVFSDKFAKLVLPAMADGCVNVELANEVKMEVTNNDPTIVLKFKRKTVRVPRYSFESITVE